MFHVNDDGDVKPCNAKSPKTCTFYRGEDDTRHAATADDAARIRDSIMEERYGKLPTGTTYSFVREFKKREKQFEDDYEGFPTRFFKADLVGKVRLLPDTYTDDFRNGDLSISPRTASVYARREVLELSKRMFKSASSPSDAGTDEEKVISTLKDLGASEVKPIHDAGTLQALRSDSGYWARIGDAQVAILPGSKGSNLGEYSFRYGKHEPFDQGAFVMTDIRTVMGAGRAQRRTGVSLLPHVIGTGGRNVPAEDHMTALDATQETLRKLQESQAESRNIISQRKYLTSREGGVATAWMDKKNPDKVHQDLMRTTKLNKVFRKVEIDNDVDPSEYADFVRSYDEVKDKLPPIPEDRKPELRIRKLGKHHASGVFFPHNNTIAVDVHDSSSFVHEYGHYLDLVVKDSQSLNREFQSITNDYSSRLKIPEGSGRKRDYYTTPTEVHSRFFEVYAHERLGISNRLVRAEDFTQFDYRPIMSDKKLKERAFTFFDKVFKK